MSIQSDCEKIVNDCINGMFNKLGKHVEFDVYTDPSLLRCNRFGIYGWIEDENSKGIAAISSDVIMTGTEEEYTEALKEAVKGTNLRFLQ